MKFISFREINSTSEYLRRNIRAEEFEVTAAETQSDDKVGRGKVWYSGKGGAYFSFYVEDKFELYEKITIFSGYAVCSVLGKYIEKSKKNRNIQYDFLKFKWPNDIYYKEKKIYELFKHSYTI